MKKMSRLFALLLALALVLGCCQVVTAEAPAELEEVDLIYWLAGNTDMPDEGLIMPELEAIAKDALNVNLKLSVIADFGEYAEKFTKAMAAQERVDLAWTGWVLDLNQLISMGAVLPMDDLLEAYGPDLIDALGETILNVHRSADGKIYHYPNWQGMVGERYMIALPKEKIDATVGEGWVQELQDVLYANWDNFTLEGRKAPYDKMEELLAALKENGMIGLGYYPFDALGWAEGGTKLNVTSVGYIDNYDDTFTVKSIYESDWEREFAHLMSEWFDKGYIRSDIASVAASINIREGWVGEDSDECYVAWGANGFTEDVSREMTDVVKPYYFVHCQPVCQAVSGGVTATIMPFTCGEPERAMMFLNWLVKGDEQATKWYNTYCYGLEGTHYEWNEDHTEIKLFANAGTGAHGGGTADWTQAPWTLGSLRNSYNNETYPKAYYEELEALQEDAWASPLFGFAFDISPVETEMVLVSSVVQEYQTMLFLGYLGADNVDAKYDEFIDKLKASGLDAVLASAQEQVNTFVEANNCAW